MYDKDGSKSVDIHEMASIKGLNHYGTCFYTAVKVLKSRDL